MKAGVCCCGDGKGGEPEPLFNTDSHQAAHPPQDAAGVLCEHIMQCKHTMGLMKACVKEGLVGIFRSQRQEKLCPEFKAY